mgnify:CR=1 FL=1
MHTFYKTELGFRTLKHRELDLNARQRRLLLLIGTEDFNTLNCMLKQRIADPELIQQLMALGLIQKQETDAELQAPAAQQDADPQHEILSQPSEIQTTLQAAPQAANKFPEQSANVRIAESAAQPAEALGFEDLKHFMIQHLQQYCGLMAKLLIEKIRQSEQLPQLKSCQMQWITQLQESRILPKNLNTALQQVNLSMRMLQGS